jgi:hypothetical protein
MGKLQKLKLTLHAGGATRSFFLVWALAGGAWKKIGQE